MQGVAVVAVEHHIADAQAQEGHVLNDAVLAGNRHGFGIYSGKVTVDSSIGPISHFGGNVRHTVTVFCFRVFPIAALALACFPPIPQPAPERLTVAMAPAVAVQRVAAALTAEGFEVAVIDASAGLLTMRRARGPKGNVDVLKCLWASSSVNALQASTVLTLSLAATPVADSAAVVLSTNATATLPDRAAPEGACASNGTAERAAAQALGVALGASASNRSADPHGEWNAMRSER